MANAILDGTDAVMLSQETAIGAYPVEAIAMMAAVAKQAEAVAPYEELERHASAAASESDPAYTLAHTLCVAARELRLDALVVPTLSGRAPAWSPPTAPPSPSTPSPPAARPCAAAA